MSRLAVVWPIVPIPLPKGPGIAISIAHFIPPPVTPLGNNFISLVPDRFSRHAEILAVTVAYFTTEVKGQHPGQ